MKQAVASRLLVNPHSLGSQLSQLVSYSLHLFQFFIKAAFLFQESGFYDAQNEKGSESHADY